MTRLIFALSLAFISSFALANSDKNYVDIQASNVSINGFVNDGHGISLTVSNHLTEKFYVKYGLSYHTGDYHDDGYSYNVANEIVYFTNIYRPEYERMARSYKSIELDILLGYEAKPHQSIGLWGEIGASAISFRREFLKTTATCGGSEYYATCRVPVSLTRDEERGLAFAATLGLSYYFTEDFAITVSGSAKQANFSIDNNNYNTKKISIGIRRGF